MSQQIATIIVLIIIVGLFVLDRDRATQTSKGLWLPFIYLLIISSRPVSSWVGIAPPDAVNGVYASPIDGAVDVALLILGLMILVTRRRKAGLLLRQSGPILLFYAYAGLSVLWSDFPYVTFKHWSKAVADVVMALIVWTDINPTTAMKRLLTWTGFILIPLSLLFSKYYPELGRGFNKDWEAVYNGVAETKNLLGIICLIAGLALLWRLLTTYRESKSAARTRHLLAHSVLLGLLIVMLRMSHSLTASVCLVLAGGVMVVISPRTASVRPARVHLAVAAALCCAVFPLFIAPSLVQSFGRDTTFSGRTWIWGILPDFVRNPWLGAGYETFLVGPRLVQLKAIIDKTFQEAHNGYLEVWLNLGWVGVLIFAVLVITGYRRVVSGYRRDPTVGSLRVALFVAVIIEGLTEAPFRMLTPTWFLLCWSMIGPWRSSQTESVSAMGSVRSQKQEDEDTNESEILIGARWPGRAVNQTSEKWFGGGDAAKYSLSEL